jgi:4'-phosphopantetheinyl transferase EntD
MIAELLPSTVVVADTEADVLDGELFPEEEASVGQAVEKRRREFVTGRTLARRALEQLGVPPAPIASGDRGQPLWPEGFVGSITHCDGYRACAVTRAERFAALGIDAERHEPLPAGVLESVASPRERERLRGAGGGVHLDRVLFSAKEALYKAWFPLADKWLGFEDVDMVLGMHDGTFSAQLLVPGPAVDGAPLKGFRGRWKVSDRVVMTAVVVPAL